MSKPNLTTLLPSKAREALEAYFFERLCNARRGHTGNPLYNILDALEDFHEDTLHTHWLREALQQTYESAFRRWEREHPYQRNPETGAYVRES